MFEWKIRMFLISLTSHLRLKASVWEQVHAARVVFFFGTSQYKGPTGETSVHTQTATNGAINNLLMVFVKAIVQHETLNNMLMIFWDWCKGRSGDLYHSGVFFFFVSSFFISVFIFFLFTLCCFSAVFFSPSYIFCSASSVCSFLLLLSILLSEILCWRVGLRHHIYKGHTHTYTHTDVLRASNKSN